MDVLCLVVLWLLLTLLAQVEPIHVALALFKDREGLARRVADKAGADLDAALRELQALQKKIPKQEPAPLDVGLSSDTLRLLKNGQANQKKNKEAHLAVDHVLLALTQEKNIIQALGNAGLTKEALERCLKDVKGSKKADSKSAEETYDALSKYGVDLVQLVSEVVLRVLLGVLLGLLVAPFVFAPSLLQLLHSPVFLESMALNDFFPARLCVCCLLFCC